MTAIDDDLVVHTFKITNSWNVMMSIYVQVTSHNKNGYIKLLKKVTILNYILFYFE